jgi:hypothetical protein
LVLSINAMSTASLQPLKDQGPNHETHRGTTVAAGSTEVVDKLLIFWPAGTESGIDGLGLNEITV